MIEKLSSSDLQMLAPVYVNSKIIATLPNTSSSKKIHKHKPFKYINIKIKTNNTNRYLVENNRCNSFLITAFKKQPDQELQIYKIR
ncbi:hypothetical protein HCH_04543 [Hahella chejuensis KCTC 2396]|uniref:Uncharacterized protein n=1 Tax=Hahella chejuensis (strain KCTC 2396) TaxID=349521 RepID=Q2SDN1_HAHCH|nr:hypothetical protein HCH_04543 [Hahella chejuensis KCTC 2396]